MANQLWFRWTCALIVFIGAHLLYLYFDKGLVDGDRNIIWYGFLTILDIIMGIALLAWRFKPFSSAIAWLCLASALVNITYGVFYSFSLLTPVWLNVIMIEMYGRITLAITGVQILGFLLAGEEIGRYSGANHYSVFSRFSDENHTCNDGYLGK